MSQKMIDAFVKKYGAKEVYGNDSQYLAMLGAFTVGWNACLEATQHTLAPDGLHCPVCQQIAGTYLACSYCHSEITPAGKA